MDERTRAQKREEIGNEIRRRQQELGHEGPMPAFLNLLTDKIVEYDDKFAQLEERLDQIDGRHQAEDDEAEREHERAREW